MTNQRTDRDAVLPSGRNLRRQGTRYKAHRVRMLETIHPIAYPSLKVALHGDPALLTVAHNN
jgi:hypothetical protein